MTRDAEVGGVPTVASGSNGRLGCGVEPGVPMVASEMLVLFERVEDDWTERGPASKRRRAAPQRVFSDRDVREIAAGLRAGFVDHAEIAIEEDAPFSRTLQDS
jgi:hypothetical protein